MQHHGLEGVRTIEYELEFGLYGIERHDRIAGLKPRVAVPLFLLFFQSLTYAGTSSSTTLTASPNPANYGQPVNLSATVTSGATGRVTFYDGSTILGTGAISGGVATISTVMLPSGSRKLRALYLGDASYAGSISTVLEVKVTTSPSLGLNPANIYPVTNITHELAESIAAGDLNGDNRLDLIIGTNTGVLVLLGNGDGTFAPGVLYNTGALVISVAVADLNGDGVPDLAVANDVSKSISILLGQGDGTFQPATNYQTTAYVTKVVIADLNSDSNPDLLVATQTAGMAVLVFMGKGDGSFQVGSPLPFSTGVSSLAVADWNGDGKPDVAVGSTTSEGVSVLLGNGDGSFQLTPTLSIGGIPSSLLAADINGDGQQDILAIGNGVEVMLGNGDGTFQPPVVSAGYSGSGPLLEDFNGDGKMDLVFAYSNFNGQTGGYVALAPGNGDGTFGPAVAIGQAGANSSSGIAGDFNGDGKIDLAVLSQNQQNYSVFLAGALPDLAISVNHLNGFTQGLAGEYQITVSNAGTYATTVPVGAVASLPGGLTPTAMTGSGWTCVLATLACTRSEALAPGASYPVIRLTVTVAQGLTGSVSSNFTVSGGGETNTANDTVSDSAPARLPSVIVLSAAPSAVLGQPFTLTATVTSGATGRVQFLDGTNVLGATRVVSGQSALTTTLSVSGNHILTAYYTGDSVYGQSLSAPLTVAINAAPANGGQITTTLPTGETVWVSTADFNGDGKPDMAAAVLAQSSGPNSIIVMLGNGDGTFRPALTYPLTASPVSIVTGDFNNDGKPDVLAITNSGLFLFSGNGDGSLTAAQSVNIALVPQSPVTADFNRDGNLDLAVLTNGIVTVFLGNGDGSFQPATMPAGSQVFTVLSASDMNGDGFADLVGVYPYGQRLSIYLGNGDGTWQPAKTTTFTFSVGNCAVVGDFNGDGKADVAILGAGTVVLPGNGDGSLGAPIFTPGWDAGYFATTGDFNGDGILDVAAVQYGAGGTVILFGKGDGTFPTSTAPGNFTFGFNIATADLNQDGRLDLMAGSGSGVAIFLAGQFSGLLISSSHNNPFIVGKAGTYQLSVSSAFFQSVTSTVTVTDILPSSLVATAISGPGWACVLSTLSCTMQGTIAIGYPPPSILLTVQVSPSTPPSVVTNQATVKYGSVPYSTTDATTIVASTTTTLVASPSSAVLGQQIMLTATVTAGATGNVVFLSNGVALGVASLANGTATLTTRTLSAGLSSVTAKYSGDATHAPSISGPASESVHSVSANHFVTPAPTGPTGAKPVSIATGDFNGDGKLDLVTANSTAGTVSVLLGNGDGTFGANTDYPTGSQPVTVLVADFNNDGIPDIAVANYSDKNISVLLGKGDGTFQPAVNTALGQTPTWMMATEFNQDGKVDLAVIAGGYYVSILLGKGDGTFQVQTADTSCDCSSGLLGDFNRDGNVDVMTSDGDLLLGNGDGTFRRQSLNYYFSAGAAAAGDLNADGKLDLIIAVGQQLTVYLGNGDGSFQQGVAYSIPQCCASNMVVTDLDGDGKTDVVLLGAVGFSFLGNGDGTLRSAVQGGWTGGSLQSGVAGDFNGDGRTDIAVTLPSTNQIAMLLGTLTPSFTVASSHSDPFSLGQTGAQYRIAVANAGLGSATEAVTVTDTLPAGLTATAIAGTGWNCVLSTVSCSRSDSLAVGASYPTISVTVNVTATTTGVVLNSAGVTDVYDSGNAVDATTIVGPAITVQTVPSGLQFTIDNGAVQTAPQSLNLSPGTHTLAVAATQSGNPGTQYVFSSWSDAGTASHNIAVGTTPATYSATFQTQYLLTTAAFPPSAGTVTAGQFYNAGSNVTLTATPRGTVPFAGWSTGSIANPLQLTVSLPMTVVANFGNPGPACTITGGLTPSVTDAQFIINEALGLSPANNDLDGDGAVTITDVQRVMNSVLLLGCLH